MLIETIAYKLSKSDQTAPVIAVSWQRHAPRAGLTSLLSNCILAESSPSASDDRGQQPFSVWHDRRIIQGWAIGAHRRNLDVTGYFPCAIAHQTGIGVAIMAGYGARQARLSVERFSPCAHLARPTVYINMRFLDAS